jgi:hypothetical protein
MGRKRQLVPGLTNLRVNPSIRFAQSVSKRRCLARSPYAGLGTREIPPTDSVCLNEIEYAQRACKIPIVPVLLPN